MLERIKQVLKRSDAFMKFYLPIHESIFTRLNKINDVFEHFFPSARPPQLTPYGFQLATSRSIHHRAMLRGKFEPEEVTTIQAILPKADVFIDVGANIGFYSCMARAQGKHVLAFEPSKRNLKYLYSSLSANGWNDVEVFPMGLSSKPGSLILYSASGTAASLIAGWDGFSKRIKETIEVSTLDIVLRNRFVSSRLFVKIDVEGAEYQVLMGAANVLSMNPKPVWLIEICLSEHHPNGVNPNFARSFEVFWQNNYIIRSAAEKDRIITPSDVQHWLRVGKADIKTSNYLMMSADFPDLLAGKMSTTT